MKRLFGTILTMALMAISANAQVYSVIGTLVGNWSVDTDMIGISENTYAAVIENVAAGSHEFKIRQDHDWSINWGDNGDGTGVQDGPNFKVEVEKDGSSVIIFFNSITHEFSIDVNKEGGNPINNNYDIWSLAGDSELFGSNWDVSDLNNKMFTIDGINYYRKIINRTLPIGTYQFKVYKDFATQISYPSSKASLEIEEDATYSINFTFNANTKELSATATKTDGLYFNFIEKGKVAELIQNPNKYKGTVIIPSTVTHEGVEYTVNKIADNAFNDCGSLTSVTIPNSVTSIGNYAFSGCTGLTSVTIPNSVTSIGDGAFNGCSGLPSITIPNSITSIGVSTFAGCSGLTSITIPNSITTIGSYAFANCGLTSITIPSSVTTIGNSSFYNCSGLTSISIPSSVTSISSSTFAGCISLTTITIPISVTSIGDHAFGGCSGLTSITIPNSVTTIGNSSFAGCSGLTSISIPNSVTSISSSTFAGCVGLTSINIPNSVNYIDGYAFYGCSGLTSINIPNSVNNIFRNAFQGCSSLKSISIGSSGMRIIYIEAFANCSDLTDVYCMAEKLSSEEWANEGLYTSTDAFKESYIEYATLHVPAAALNSYKNTEPWKNFKNIVAIGDGDIPETPKCAKPEISFENGIVKFTCETEGVEYISEVKLADEHKYYDAEIQLSQTYKVSVYAAKAGYENSDIATREIVITGNGKAIVVGDVDGDGKVNVADHVKLSDIIMNNK